MRVTTKNFTDRLTQIRQDAARKTLLKYKREFIDEFAHQISKSELRKDKDGDWFLAEKFISVKGII